MSGLVVRGLVKQYPEFTLYLDCEVPQGSLTTLLGPSGCGKSTALSVITGIEDQQQGSIILAGRDISHVPPWDRNIGLVFQDYALFPHMSAGANIAYGLHIRSVSRQEIKRTVAHLLELIGLEGYEHRRINELSGGEQQRIALARALAPKPDLLLLDEPLSALDAKLRVRLRAEIQRIQRELGVTTIYVTHDQEEALDISDEIIVMNRGRIEQVGTPQEIYHKPQTLFCGTFIGTSSQIPEGDRVLFFRPEHVQVAPDDPRGRIFTNCLLERKRYRGFFYEYLFNWKGHQILAHGDGSLFSGASCTLAVDRKHLADLEPSGETTQSL